MGVDYTIYCLDCEKSAYVGRLYKFPEADTSVQEALEGVKEWTIRDCYWTMVLFLFLRNHNGHRVQVVHDGAHGGEWELNIEEDEEFPELYEVWNA